MLLFQKHQAAKTQVLLHIFLFGDNSLPLSFISHIKTQLCFQIVFGKPSCCVDVCKDHVGVINSRYSNLLHFSVVCENTVDPELFLLPSDSFPKRLATDPRLVQMVKLASWVCCSLHLACRVSCRLKILGNLSCFTMCRACSPLSTSKVQ